MRTQNLRKVKWCSKALRAYVVWDWVRYWSPQETVITPGRVVGVLNPTTHSVTVRCAGMRETWCADAPQSNAERSTSQRVIIPIVRVLRQNPSATPTKTDSGEAEEERCPRCKSTAHSACF